ncbi:MAG: S9 family peptidase [Sphingobacteriales bacterium]|nr:MAG: S9 family peptidase [Sphingobacteriales bacterium]
MRYIILALAIATSQFSFAQNGSKEITLEDIWKNSTFRMKSVPGFNAMKDGKRYTQITGGKDLQTIQIYDLQTGKATDTIFRNTKIIPTDGTQIFADDYSFSKDEQKMLLKAESQNVYRRSVLNKVYVYNISTGKVEPLHDEKVLHATFSPDGNKVAFVKGNNLYYKDLTTNQTTAVTTDGEWNKIINGNCDWVYEEEFEFTRAFDWSPDGKYLAYYRFDESKVPEFTMPMYGKLYPANYTYKYPKAGEPNSVVQIKIYDVAAGKTVNANIGTEIDQYIPRIKWSNDAKQLCIFRMNRLQNKLELLLTDATSGAANVIYEETNPYYVEVNDNLAFLKDGHSFIFNSERDGYNHLYHWDWQSKKLTDLTKGNYDIEHIIGIDENTKQVYYTAAEASPMERKLYAVGFNGKNKKTLTPEGGVHAITPIEGYKYFLDRHSRLNEPPVYYLRDAKGKVIRTLEDNKDLKNKMQEFALGNISFTTVDGANSSKLNAWMITPPNFDKNKKYPVLMYQYSGPGSQEVADRFPVRDFFWHQMLAQKGYIVVCADGTGTGYRGQEFKKKTYLQLGKLESDDQIAAAQYLGTLPYVDKSRIGIWGWSYGGFMSSTAIFKGADVFKMAVAVAPVSNWRYYDNIYTERYMRTPQENAKGYDENAPEKMADKLKGKYLMIHGTADDNVHFQNAVMLTEAMIKADKEFDTEYYPNKNHGISGGNTRYHLYKRMTDFVLNNL